MDRRTRFVPALAVALALFAAGPAAQQPRSGLEERVEVEFVLLDVIASDRKGRPITDLTAEDFTVLEDKRPVTVQSFDTADLRRAVVARPAVERSAEPAQAAPGPLRFIVAIDLEFASGPEIRRSFSQLEAFLEDTPERPNVAWLPYSLERGFLLPDFEPDPARVKQALAAYEREYMEQRFETNRTRARGGDDDDALGSDDLPELEARFQRCLESSNQPHQCILAELDLFVTDLETRTRRVIEELSTLADRFGSLDRINTVVFLSPGFSLRPGAAATALAAIYLEGPQRAQEMAPESRRSPFALSPPRTPRSFEDEFRRVIHAAVKHRVVFHAFDLHHFNIVGRRQSSPEFMFASSRVVDAYRDHGRELNDGMRALAEESGGKFRSGPDLERLELLMERTMVVYTLGYPSPPGGGGEFRKIKVKCRRKGVKLLHRAGYFAR